MQYTILYVIFVSDFFFVIQKAGLRPPTSVVNLIFVLANHAAVSPSPVAAFCVQER